MSSFGKFSLIVAFAGLVAIPFASAQTTQTPPPDFVWGVCPVLHAEHSPGLGGQVPVGADKSVGGGTFRRDGQHLELKLTNSGSKTAAISEIRITVRGWKRGTGAALPAQKTKSDLANAIRTVIVAVSIAPHAIVTKDVWVRGLASVDSIDVNEVSYADGSTWNPDSGACRIVPDPLMQVSKK